MNSGTFLNPLRHNLRQGNLGGLQYQVTKVLKRSTEVDCTPRLKTEIYLEAVKAFRMLNRHAEAVALCDLSIENIPAGSFDLLSALKRLRSLLYLDAGDVVSARSLIEETDGLEMILTGGKSVVTRSDVEVTVETWLVSTEVALAQKDIAAAHDFFSKAVTRLSSEESDLRRKRISFSEKVRLQQYYHDLSQILNLFALTLQLITGDTDAKIHLRQLSEKIAQENRIAVQENKLPNVPLYRKYLCLIGEYSGLENENGGISSLEARRWQSFASPDYLRQPIVSTEPAFSGENAIVGDEFVAESSALTSFPNAEYVYSAQIPGVTEKALSVSAQALEKMASAFNKIEKVLPHFESYLKGQSSVDYTQRGWSGHCLDTDLNSFLFNISTLKFTGYIKFVWKDTLYESAIMKGLLPEFIRCGEAYLYAAEGVVIDAVFKDQLTSDHSVKKAQDNFLLITRLTLSIHVDGIRPDIIGTAVPSQDVLERPRLIRVRPKDMIWISGDLGEMAAGIQKPEGDLSFFEAQAQTANAPEDESFDFNFMEQEFGFAEAAEDVAVLVLGETFEDETKEKLPAEISPAASINLIDDENLLNIT